MKLQCDLCREIVAADLTIRGDQIEVHCPSCDGRFSVSSSPVPVPVPVPGGPSMTCPKCGLTQSPAAACRACGLAAERMSDFTSRADDAPAAVADAWTACARAWTDADLHETLARETAAHNAYAWTARRYREHLRSAPDDAIATARLARITRITEATLRAGGRPRPDRAPGAPEPKPYRAVVMFLVALVLLAAAGTIYALASTSPPDDTGAPPIPVKPHR